MAHSEDCTTYREMVPWLVAGTLPEVERTSLELHLPQCAACQQALAAWQSIAVEAKQGYVQPSQSFAMAWQGLSQRLAQQALREEQPVRQQEVFLHVATMQRSVHTMTTQQLSLWGRASNSVKAFVRHGGQVLRAQIFVMHKSIWLTTLLATFLGFSLTLSTLLIDHHYDRAGLIEMLVVMTLGASAIGATRVYGSEHDPGLEIALSTATPSRTIVLCRLTLVVLYNCLLAVCASACIDLAFGGGLWTIVQFWLGPLLLFTPLSLLLSLLVNSAFTTSAILLLDFTQLLRVDFSGSQTIVRIVTPAIWQTSPLILVLAFGCIILVTLSVPRQSGSL